MINQLSTNNQVGSLFHREGRLKIESWSVIPWNCVFTFDPHKWTRSNGKFLCQFEEKTNHDTWTELRNCDLNYGKWSWSSIDLWGCWTCIDFPIQFIGRNSDLIHLPKLLVQITIPWSTQSTKWNNTLFTSDDLIPLDHQVTWWSFLMIDSWSQVLGKMPMF